MANTNMRQIYAYEKKLKDRILKIYPTIKNTSGIYILTREENGFKYAYVGQAVKLLTRLAGHLKGYQHIDLSLKKHGLYSEANELGWKIKVKYCSDLNEQEQAYIKLCADKGYQLYNHTTGSQGKGKAGLKETVRKGYQEGVANGYKKAQKLVANLFDKHLDYSVKKEGNKNQIKAMAKFEEFMNDIENKKEKRNKMKNRNLEHKDDWKTPDYLYSKLNNIYKFDFDPCPLNHDITKWDGLKINWGKSNFVNPPYSRKLKELFINKAIEEMQKGNKSIMLIPVSTSTKIFHEKIMKYASEIMFIKKRIKFQGYNTDGEFVENKCGMHDSMIIVFEPNYNNELPKLNTFVI